MGEYAIPDGVGGVCSDRVPAGRRMIKGGRPKPRRLPKPSPGEIFRGEKNTKLNPRYNPLPPYIGLRRYSVTANGGNGENKTENFTLCR